LEACDIRIFLGGYCDTVCSRRVLISHKSLKFNSGQREISNIRRHFRDESETTPTNDKKLGRRQFEITCSNTTTTSPTYEREASRHSGYNAWTPHPNITLQAEPHHLYQNAAPPLLNVDLPFSITITRTNTQFPPDNPLSPNSVLQIQAFRISKSTTSSFRSGDLKHRARCTNTSTYHSSGSRNSGSEEERK